MLAIDLWMRWLEFERLGLVLDNSLRIGLCRNLPDALSGLSVSSWAANAARCLNLNLYALWAGQHLTIRGDQDHTANGDHGWG